MPELLDHVAYLSQEIGPRPAGTEEEQQAALYITEQMQKEAGLSAAIEDFGGAPNSDAPRVLCCILALVVAALSLFLPVLGIASIAITAITALLFAAEAFDHPVLSKAFARGVSQNVVAKYEPGFSTEAGGSRRRKVILVAHYDSGKVRAELNGPLLKLLPILQWAELVAMVLLPVLLVVRNIVFANDTGMAVTVMNVLVVIALVPLAIVLIFALVHKLAAYNEAANCNAAGTAVLLETARRVGRGRVSEADLAEIRRELREQGYLKGGVRADEKVKKTSEPLHFRSTEGFEILVGRNNRQNDQLTLKTAKATDIWLHTQGIAGSHVIIRTEGRQPGEQTLFEAAQLAAFHSKGRSGSGVPVDYAAVKFVKKPAGAKPGMVIFTNNRTLYVTPDESLVNSLKAK